MPDMRISVLRAAVVFAIGAVPRLRFATLGMTDDYRSDRFANFSFPVRKL
jgi:hypothetical protein